MLKGDLASTPLPEVLRQLADGGATGCLHVVDAAEACGQVYLRGGRVYAATLPGERPTLGARLVTSGALAPEALAEAVEAQETELQGWRLSELLVHLGYVDQPVVEAFVQEQVRERLSDLLMWTDGTWRFRLNQRTREDVAPLVEVQELLTEVEHRRRAWQEIARVVHGPDAVPVLSAAGTADDEMVVDGDAWSMLCKVDGARTLAELARDCGLTLFEAGHVLHGLVAAGLLEVEAPDAVDAAAAPDAAPSLQDEDLLPAARPVDETAQQDPAEGAAPQPDLSSSHDRRGRIDGVPRGDGPRALGQPDQDQVDHSISRVSQALAAMLGQSTSTDDLFAAPRGRRTAPVDPVREERARQQAARRERDGAELAAAQAELEADRAADQERRAAELDVDHVAEVVDLQARRDEDLRQAEQAEALHAAEEARIAEEARLAEETRAEETRLAEEARIAEETRLAEEARAADEARIAEEAEAAREADARRDEELRVAAAVRQAEQAQAAEEVRLAEEAEAAREAEDLRLAQEEEAHRLVEQAEHDRLVAEQAEHDRLVAEQAAAMAAAAGPGAASYGDMARESAQLHADVFAELTAAATVPVGAPPAEDEPEPQEPAAVLEEAERAHREGTDTAALLRELSSLGLSDDPAPAPQTRPVSSAPRPVSSQPPAKKRKSLFGR